MGKIGAIQDQLSEDSEEGFMEGISYITDEVRSILKQLPSFETVTELKKA